MNVSVLQENLLKGLNIVRRAVESRPQLPVLANVLLETDGSRLKLAATNLQMSVTAFIGAQVHTEGSITLPMKTLYELVTNLSPERVDMTLDARSQTVNIRCGATMSNIKGIDADEFPPVNHANTGEVAIGSKLLKEMIGQTAFAAAKDDARPILTGVYTEIKQERLTMAAADGYRLAMRTGALDEAFRDEVSIVIPAKTLMDVAGIIEDDDEPVSISLPGERDIVTFHLKDVEVSSQLLEGRFPDFRAIIPRGYVTSTVMYRNDLLAACKRAEIFARDNANSGRLAVKPPKAPGEPGEVRIIGKSAERGDNEGMLDASIEGEELDISFNISYLIEVLRVLSNERVVFQSNGNEKPGVLRLEERDDFIHVIMPMSR
jgi:DNA polymerase III subunit beta